MPELPEVETIVRELQEASLEGLSIEKADIFWERSVACPQGSLFGVQITNQIIQNISRRGKFLVFFLSKDVLLVHLRMTGKFILEKERSEKESCPVHAHERIRLYLSDKRILRYEDQRKFGKWYLVEESGTVLANVGVEPLSSGFTLQAFKTILAGYKRQIKPFLLDQRFIAGLGNIYADEALWLAKIHPLRLVNQLNEKEVEALHLAIVSVLTQGVKNTGTSLGAARANYFSISGRRGGNQQQLNVFRREGLPCPRCQTTIQKSVVGQRGTHFCPYCQAL